jgi:hypothetical protein
MKESNPSMGLLATEFIKGLLKPYQTHQKKNPLSVNFYNFNYL